MTRGLSSSRQSHAVVTHSGAAHFRSHVARSPEEIVNEATQQFGDIEARRLELSHSGNLAAGLDLGQEGVIMVKPTVLAKRFARLRSVCLAHPEATEKIAWGDPTWRVRDRIFAMQKGNYDGGRPSVWLKAAPGAQDTLVDARPSLFFVPPYVGHKGWIGIYLDEARHDWEVIGDLITDSYRLVAGPRLAARLTVSPAPAKPVRTASPAKPVRAASPKKPVRAVSPAKPVRAARSSKAVRGARPAKKRS
jgi:predicted DNA-binding protein (MmcQ/YjbR family)